MAVDGLSETMARAFLGLGSNLGDRQRLIEEALHLLNHRVGRLLVTSSYYETQPAGGPPGQPLFLNAVALVETTLPPRALLKSCQLIENQLGRVRTVRWEPRTIDIDILLYDDLLLKTDDLEIPHPRLAVRRFVLEPLAEIAPWAVHPHFRKSVGDLWRQVQATARLCWLILLGSSFPLDEWKNALEDLATVIEGDAVRPLSDELTYRGMHNRWTCVVYTAEVEPKALWVEKAESVAKSLAIQRQVSGTPRVLFLAIRGTSATDQEDVPSDATLGRHLTEVGLVPWLQLGRHTAEAISQVRAALIALS